MKKIKIIVITCIMIFSLIGCSSKTSSDKQEKQDKQDQEEQDQKDDELIDQEQNNEEQVTPTEVVKDVPKDDAELENDSEGTIREFAANEEVYVDIDGDTIIDKISYKLKDYNFIFIINNVEYSGNEEFQLYEPEQKFRIVDIDTSDSYLELAVSTYGPSDDLETVYYYYHEGVLDYVGRTGGIPMVSDIEFDLAGQVIAPMRLSILQTWWGKQVFALTKEHMLEPTEQEFYDVNSKSEIELLIPLIAYKEPDKNSEGITIPIQKGKLTATDNMNWCKFEGEDGTKGWFFVSGFGDLDDMQMEANDVIEGLLQVD